MTSLQLELGMPGTPEPLPPEPSIDDRFLAFHRANPSVARDLIRLVEAERQAGYERTSMKLLFEVLRWHHRLATTGSEFRLNNNFTSRYVRLISERRPDLASMFVVRCLADEREAA